MRTPAAGQFPGGASAAQQFPRGPSAAQQFPRGGTAAQQFPRGGSAAQQFPRGGSASQQFPGDVGPSGRARTGSTSGNRNLDRRLDRVTDGVDREWFDDHDGGHYADNDRRAARRTDGRTDDRVDREWFSSDYRFDGDRRTPTGLDRADDRIDANRDRLEARGRSSRGLDQAADRVEQNRDRYSYRYDASGRRGRSDERSFMVMDGTDDNARRRGDNRGDREFFDRDGAGNYRDRDEGRYADRDDRRMSDRDDGRYTDLNHRNSTRSNASASARARAEIDLSRVRAQDIGIRFDSSSDALIVNNVSSRDLLSRIGLQRGDEIAAVDGQRVWEESDFIQHLLSAREEVPITIFRDGRRETLWVGSNVINGLMDRLR